MKPSKHTCKVFFSHLKLCSVSFFAKKVHFLPPKHVSCCFSNEFLHHYWQECFDGDSIVSQSRFDAYATVLYSIVLYRHVLQCTVLCCILTSTLLYALRTKSLNIIGWNHSMVIPLLANHDLTPMLFVYTQFFNKKQAFCIQP